MVDLDEPLLLSSSPPSWLDPSQDEDHRSLMSGLSSSNRTQTEVSWAAEDLPGDMLSGENQPAGLAKAILSIRIINIGAALALITCSFFSMQLTLSPTRLILSGYGVCFGVLLFCLEVQLEFLERRIAASCGFLYNPGFRFMFLLLTASLAWSQHHLFSDITSAVLICVAVINLYVMCRYSEFEETRERLAKEEERAMTQKLRKETARHALRQVTGTESDWL